MHRTSVLFFFLSFLPYMVLAFCFSYDRDLSGFKTQLKFQLFIKHSPDNSTLSLLNFYIWSYIWVLFTSCRNPSIGCPLVVQHNCMYEVFFLLQNKKKKYKATKQTYSLVNYYKPTHLITPTQVKKANFVNYPRNASLCPIPPSTPCLSTK